MCDTCVPSLIVISTAINQLETKVSLKTIWLFVVVYKHVMLQHLRKLWVKYVIKFIPFCMFLTLMSLEMEIT